MGSLEVIVVAAVVLIAAAEVVARLAERRLPMYLHWHDRLTTGKWLQLHELRQADPVDVVLTGSSQILTALDPTEMPFRCYNAGLYRGVPTVTAQWLRDEVLPATRPRLVVWGVSILDLNDNGRFHAGILKRYSDARARRGGRIVQLRRRSALLRRAPMLLHPRATGAQVRALAETDPTSTKPLSSLLGLMGKGMEFAFATEYRLSTDKAQFVRDEIAGGFAMGGAQVDAIRRGAAAIRAAGADLMLLEVPCTDEFVQMYPRGQADADAANAVLRELADELNVPLVPLTQTLPREWFYDAVHLNGTGMCGWTAQVAPLIAARLAVPPAGVAPATLRRAIPKQIPRRGKLHVS